jgi:DNA processing protein
MCAPVELSPADARYPERLKNLPSRPTLDLSGPLDERRLAIAIVGARRATPESRAFAAHLAGSLARAGVVVISGGAEGIDTAAHTAALEAGGHTWVVAPTGRDHVFPPSNRALFASIAASGSSRMIWPFPPDTRSSEPTYLARNGVLVALSDGVVVIQARHASGSRNAMRWARELGRTLWVVPTAPWDSDGFEGSNAELSHARTSVPRGGGERRPSDVRALVEPAQLLRELGLPSAPPDPNKPSRGRKGRSEPLPFPLQRGAPRRRHAVPAEGLSGDENSIISSISASPMHLDDIAEKAGLSAAAAATALLTLALKDVVVEGPDGFFRLEPGR